MGRIIAGDAQRGFDRVEYEAGNEHNPGDPFGRTVLVIDALGVARLENYRIGQHHAWTGVIDPAVLSRLTAALQAAGFPAAPRLPVPAGSALRHLSVSGALSGQVLLPWHGVAQLAGYNDAFAVLDSLVRQLSRGALAVAPDVLPPSVLDVWQR
ncbi:uncharacterized protein SOCE26_001260 [Sorangium cellulosum]|uniref:Uncharacterized protein n=1 Tax=Sorangium cellulosum TaxID=56 RepID=A0A2L0EHH8_SORCE|nr:hypothetical protein [Sorangium cellulosum]AUX38748.1 uncharacterized protein SOCE26_001260 [Sorangium cellulosum]